MDAERDGRAGEIVQAALRFPPAERAAYLDKTCAVFGCDAALRREVDSLLAGEDSAEQFIPTSAIKQAARQLAEEPTEEEPPEMAAGTVIEHYRILKLLGAGGMGDVYLAEDLALKRSVAIKFLSEEFAAHPDRVRRFEQEAYAASALNHPNIITIFEVGQYAGSHYIAYELVEGQTLRQRISNAKLDWQEAVNIGVQIAAALKAAHSAGIIHRDIKPENVMLRADGLVKVLDFGIAKRFDLPAVKASGGATAAFANAVQATLDGQVLGTIGYLSPEQARGDKADVRTDVFSLGVMLFEMLADHPFAGLTPQEKLSEIASEKELPPIVARRKGLPAALVAIVTKATAKSREVRYASADEMLDALDQLRPPIETRTAENAQKRLARENANRLLNQFVALAARDRGARLSPGALWTIWCHSDIKRGKLERKLLRKSFASMLFKTFITAIAAAILTLGVVVPLSIEEKWPEKILRDGHTAQVRQLALSPDGRTLVSVGNDNRAIVWDFARRARLATLEHSGTKPVSVAAFSPDGKWLATASSDGTIVVWDTAMFEKAVTLPGPHSGADTIAFTPDGRLLLAPEDHGGGGTVNVWEVGTWTKIRGLPAFGSFVVSPDSRLLINFWLSFDLRTGKEFADCFDPSWTSGALSPDATRLATVDGSGLLGIWDVSQFWQTASRKLLNRYPAHRDHGRAVAYSPDGRMIATGGENIIIWDAVSFAKIARFAHKDRVLSLVFTKDARQLISAHGDGAILVWDIAEKEARANFAEHIGPVHATKFSPDGQSIASASEDGSIIIWDAARGVKKNVLLGHHTRVSDVVFAPKGKRLASIDLEGISIVWDAAKWEQLYSIAPIKRLENVFGYAVAISPDEQWLVTSFGVYGLADGRMVAELIPKNNWPKDTRLYQEIYGAAFSADGRWLACVTPNRGLLLLEVGTWQLRQPTGNNPGQLISVSFSPDSQWLVTGEDQGNVRLWQVEPLQEVAVLGQHKSYIRSVAFSHDGKQVASASDDKTIKLWDVAQHRELSLIGTHTSPVLAVEFSPDDKQLVSGEHDKSVRLYERRRSLWGWRLE